MATLLDVSLLGNFTNIFVFLFVWLVVFGILELTHIFGSSKKGLNTMIAFIVALLVLLSKTATSIINFLISPFIVVAIALFFIFFLVKMFGVSDNATSELIKSPAVYVPILVVAALIIIFAITNSFGQKILEQEPLTDEDGNSTTTVSSTETGGFQDNLYDTFFNKKVLGLIVVLLVAVFAIAFLARTPKIG